MPRLLLVGHCGVTGADTEVGGGQHDVRRRLPEVVQEQVLVASVLRLPDDEGDRRRGPGNVPRPLPDLRQLDQLRAIRDDNKVPRLPVARGRGPPTGVKDALKVPG